MLLNYIKRILPGLLITIVLVFLIYFIFFRPWLLKLGVSSEELEMTLTGDELILNPGMEYMHGVTINAPREVIWKYLIQVGYKRAGWYNLDFINRLFADEYFYENNKSADRIIPELQNLKIGDEIYLNPQLGMTVTEIKPNETILLTGKEKGNYVASWVYQLNKIDQGSTRLLVRWNSQVNDSLFYKIVNLLFMEPASAIQQHYMLKGLKYRAEKEPGIN